MSVQLRPPKAPSPAATLTAKAHNRTPPGIPVDEWQAQRNAAKRARRARKGKR